MNIRNILAATQRGFADKAKAKGAAGVDEGAPVKSPSTMQRLLSATSRGLGTKSGAKAESIAKGMASVKVVMATGLYKTAAGVVGQKLFKENARALRAYLAVQLRGSTPAGQAILALEDAMEHGTADEYRQGPSQRAALFLSARNLVEFERLFGETPLAGPSAVPWELTPPGKIDGWGRALDEIRYGLGENEAELLMLRHVCGLNEAEVGYVLSVATSEVARNVEAAIGYAKLLLEGVFEGEPPDLEELLADAYAVIPPTPAELAAASRPKAVPLPPGTLLGDRYEVEATLGGGEFAYVYRARDVRVPGHVVALKLLHRVARTHASREGAIRELSLIASAFHPSLVQFKDHGWYEDRLWFVMPFYQGEMLLDRLGRGSLPLDDALAHFERLARGLAALHAAGIRHQDVKPENIYFVELRTGKDEERPEILPVLLDLGVASPNGEMALAGTPMYFPPEVAARINDAQCEIPLTPKTDVFALALSLLHSIEEPDLSELDGVEVDEFLQRRMNAAPRGPRGKELSFLLPRFARWLAKHPDDRPTAGELADEIAEVRAERAGTSPTSRRAPWGLRGAVVVLALVALLLGAALVVSPMRPAEVAEDATTESAPASRATDRERLLRQRLRTEEERALELEEELSRLRREELGLASTERSEPPDE